LSITHIPIFLIFSHEQMIGTAWSPDCMPHHSDGEVAYK